ncbi:hypothetical protein R1flu_004505 [Riccia fluitans]|uniref:Uncharacterized protein n=1 Tax=Riccia fluitans TaxID=41844 RepID=A0ABD1YQH3_9MARC
MVLRPPAPFRNFLPTVSQEPNCELHRGILRALSERHVPPVTPEASPPAELLYKWISPLICVASPIWAGGGRGSIVRQHHSAMSYESRSTKTHHGSILCFLSVSVRHVQMIQVHNY